MNNTDFLPLNHIIIIMATAATDVNPRKRTLEEFSKDNPDVKDGAQEPVCSPSK